MLRGIPHQVGTVDHPAGAKHRHIAHSDNLGQQFINGRHTSQAASKNASVNDRLPSRSYCFAFLTSSCTAFDMAKDLPPCTGAYSARVFRRSFISRLKQRRLNRAWYFSCLLVKKQSRSHALMLYLRALMWLKSTD
jgi:hypothetical protein